MKIKTLTKSCCYTLLIHYATVLYSPAAHAEISYEFSGFGTLGYAVSDKDYDYVKYISNDGTFNYDSLIGGQLDIQLTPKLSSTFQVQYAPDASEDSGWEPELSWAFLSYRPTNDWLIRGGKLRIPGYLNSENRDIGVTYDYLRVPVEFDSLSPSYDFIGLSVNKSFLLEDGDLSVDLYHGQIDTDFRLYFRNEVNEIYASYPQGSFYIPITLEFTGSAVTYQTDENTYVASVHYAISNQDGSEFAWYDSPVYQDAGYYSYEGASLEDKQEVVLVNIGADIHLGNDVRLAAEFAGRRAVGDLMNGQNGYAGYISLRRPFGNWTPYFMYSRLRTDSEQLELYEKLNDTSLAFQKAIADSYQGYDQYSVAFGSSYSITPASKLKAEVTLTHIGVTSSLVDAPSGSSVSDADITIFSIAYSFAF